MKKKNLNIGFVQNNPQNCQAREAMKHTLVLIKALLKQKPDVILLPEMFLGSPGKKISEKNQCASLYADFLLQLKQMARVNKICFFGSQLAREKQGKGFVFYNQAFFLSAQGKISGTYEKIHLFRFDQEQKLFSKGKGIKQLSTPWGPAAMLVCYDIRFPELLRQQALWGAKMAFVTAQWPASRDAHWMSLLKARAIENQLFVFASNRIGTKKQQAFIGHSCVISPWGKVLYKMKKTQKTGSCIIELSEVDQVRKDYPFLKDSLCHNFHFDILP